MQTSMHACSQVRIAASRNLFVMVRSQLSAESSTTLKQCFSEAFKTKMTRSWADPVLTKITERLSLNPDRILK